jgi:competence protein ComGC
MFCSSCGKEARESAGFCQNCGARLGAPPAAQPRPGIPPVVVWLIAGVVCIGVISVIAIIAAIAIPNLIRARSQAAEVRAIQSIRLLHQAQAQYQAQSGRYASSLEQLDTLIPSDLASGVSGGYRFRVQGNASSYEIHAEPLTGNSSWLYSDQTGAIRRSRHSAIPSPVSPMQ